MSTFQQSPRPSWPHARARLVRRTIWSAVALAMGTGLAACGGTQMASPDLRGLPSAEPPAMPFAAPVTEPDAEIVALADRMLLTSEGRQLFYLSQPQLTDADMVRTACAGAADEGAEDGDNSGA